MHALSKVSRCVDIRGCVDIHGCGAILVCAYARCRQFHNHVVDVVNRLVEGIKAKGSGAVVNFADIGQVSRRLTNSFL